MTLVPPWPLHFEQSISHNPLVFDVGDVQLLCSLFNYIYDELHRVHSFRTLNDPADASGNHLSILIRAVPTLIDLIAFLTTRVRLQT